MNFSFSIILISFKNGNRLLPFKTKLELRLSLEAEFHLQCTIHCTRAFNVQIESVAYLQLSDTQVSLFYTYLVVKL